jgi:hypothetical protein
MVNLVAAGIVVFVMASLNISPVIAQTQAANLPFQVQAVAQEQWTADKFPPPGIAWAGNSVTVVAPMVFGDPCRAPNVEVRSTPSPSSNATIITVELLAPLSRLSAEMSCMAVLWPVYIIVTIPDLPAGQYSIDVRTSLYGVNIGLPNRGGRVSSKGEILPWSRR